MISDLYSKINTLAQASPVVASVIGLYGLGIVTYLCKDIPTKILVFIKKHFTTTVNIANFNISYYKLMALFEKNKIVDKIRNIKFYNGRWGGSDDEIIKGIGVGTHWLWYNNVPISITISSKDTVSNEEKLEVTLAKFGRSHKLFDTLRAELMIEEIRDRNKTAVWSYSYGGGWNKIVTNPARVLDSIILQKERKDLLIKTIQNFISNEKWYLDHGIPYQLGIMLHGEAGTGKTSLIKGIASYFNRDIATISVSNLSSLRDALGDLPKNCLLVIEDVDTHVAVHEREDDKHIHGAPTSKHKKDKDAFGEMVKMSLSDILNSIDGLINLHGRIMIMTTNHIEKLDSAFIRPGRIDLKLEVSYIDSEMMVDFLKRFFPDKQVKSIRLKRNNLTVSTLQNEYMQGKTFDQFIEEYTYV